MLVRLPLLAKGCLLIPVLLAGLVPRASGQEFRVDTEVFYGQDKVPGVEALTIFANGRVYDFLLKQREITLFDPSRGQFTLLDEARRAKATVTTQDLMGFALDLETHAVEGKHTLLAFAARPKFETTSEEVNENGQQLVRIKLSGKPLEYGALGQKPLRPKRSRFTATSPTEYARLTRPAISICLPAPGWR
jgi:hypothetical protein